MINCKTIFFSVPSTAQTVPVLVVNNPVSNQQQPQLVQIVQPQQPGINPPILQSAMLVPVQVVVQPQDGHQPNKPDVAPLQQILNHGGVGEGNVTHKSAAKDQNKEGIHQVRDEVREEIPDSRVVGKKNINNKDSIHKYTDKRETKQSDKHRAELYPKNRNGQLPAQG